ncbi:MAG: hypothetical protein SGARI_006921, partial [Bacillariaceae sp.]
MPASPPKPPLGLCKFGDDVMASPEKFIVLRPNQFLGRTKKKFQKIEEDLELTSPAREATTNPRALNDSSNSKDDKTTVMTPVPSNSSKKSPKKAKNNTKEEQDRVRRSRENYAELGIHHRQISSKCLQVAHVDEASIRLSRKQDARKLHTIIVEHGSNKNAKLKLGTTVDLKVGDMLHIYADDEAPVSFDYKYLVVRNPSVGASPTATAR